MNLSAILPVIALAFGLQANAFESFECSHPDGSKLGTLRIDGFNSYLIRGTDLQRCSLLPGDANPTLMACAKESKPNGRDTVVDISVIEMILLDRTTGKIRLGLFTPDLNYFAMGVTGSCK